MGKIPPLIRGAINSRRGQEPEPRGEIWRDRATRPFLAATCRRACARRACARRAAGQGNDCLGWPRPSAPSRATNRSPPATHYPAAGNRPPRCWQHTTLLLATGHPAAGNRPPCCWQHTTLLLATHHPVAGNTPPCCWQQTTLLLAADHPAAGSGLPCCWQQTVCCQQQTTRRTPPLPPALQRNPLNAMTLAGSKQLLAVYRGTDARWGRSGVNQSR